MDFYFPAEITKKYTITLNWVSVAQRFLKIYRRVRCIGIRSQIEKQLT